MAAEQERIASLDKRSSAASQGAQDGASVSPASEAKSPLASPLQAEILKSTVNTASVQQTHQGTDF